MNKREIEGTLLLSYLNETASSEECKQVEAWLAEDPANSETLLQLARVHHAQRTRWRIRQRNTNRALDSVHRRIRQRIRRITFWRMAVAASLLFGIFGTATMLRQYRQSALPPQMITVYTNPGMRSQMTLPDGTEVFLNAGSTLVYPSHYDKNERRVHLSGEAFFKVEHHNDWPFKVTTPGEMINIYVLGTQFNLQAYEKDSLVQVSLIEGSVQMDISGKMEKIQLKPSYRVTYNMLTEQVYQEKINTTRATDWLDGRLIFKDTQMSDVLRQLANFYSVEFNVHDEEIYGYTFTGTFDNRPLFQILEYMRISSKINYTMLCAENEDVDNTVIQLKIAKKNRK